jgi:drug/metabolite transporter (DMT)-like permease
MALEKSPLFEKMKVWRLNGNIYGAVLILASAICSSIMNSLTRALPQNISAWEALFFKCLISLGILCVLRFKTLPTIIRTRNFSIQLLKGVCAAIGGWSLIASLQHLPLAEVSALSLSSALFTSLGGWIFYREKMRMHIIGGLILSGVGVGLILGSSFKIASFYSLLPLLSAFAFSGSSLLVKKLSRADKSQTTLFYLMALTSFFALCPMLYTWVTPSGEDWFKLFGIGAFYILTQFCLIEAYTYAAASFLAPFKFARFPFNVLAGVLLFLEWPPMMTLGGSLLIMSAYFWLLKSEKNN